MGDCGPDWRLRWSGVAQGQRKVRVTNGFEPPESDITRADFTTLACSNLIKLAACIIVTSKFISDHGKRLYISAAQRAFSGPFLSLSVMPSIEVASCRPSIRGRRDWPDGSPSGQGATKSGPCRQEASTGFRELQLDFACLGSAWAGRNATLALHCAGGHLPSIWNQPLLASAGENQVGVARFGGFW
jgi:hypothetical protein